MFEAFPTIYNLVGQPQLCCTMFAGMTIHSWGVVSPSQDDLNKQIKCIQGCKPALNQWRKTQVLIVNEGEHLNSQSHLTT